MNADIPYIRCWVRLCYIAQDKGWDMEEAYAFAIQSHPGRALGFHVMLQSGAHYRNVPIHALALRQDASPRRLAGCQFWDCFSSRPIVTVFQYLRDHAADCYTADGKIPGMYLFTVDWLPDSPERPGFLNCPEQTKCAHVLALDDGNLAALPTNRIAWKDGYFIGQNPDPAAKKYKVQSEAWRAEEQAFDASTDEAYFYGLQKPARDSVDGISITDTLTTHRPLQRKL